MRDLSADRARAESFGSVASDYARLRPSPPAELVDELVALAPSRVLDVGCGTGKVAGALAARGLSVLGIEIDVRMAALAPCAGRDRVASRTGMTAGARST